MTALKQIEVTIMGQSYVLGCPEGGEAALLEAVASVDREMSAIRAKGKLKARERIAVLAALNLAYQLAEHGVAPGSDGSEPGRAKPDIDALIRRVDQSLGHDGQLL
jgi:cell division protein ZapA